MSVESLRRQVAEIRAAVGASRGPRHILWLPDDAAKLAEMRRNGVSEGDILAIQWIPESAAEPKGMIDDVGF
jgi:hypothetical protein